VLLALHCGTLAAADVDDAMQAGHSVLIFCCSKAQCEIVAKHIARLITIPERPRPPNHATAGGATDTRAETEVAAATARASLASELARLTARPGSALKEVVSRGVAFHHAGLTAEERELVEKAYCQGVYCHIQLLPGSCLHC